MENKKIYEYSKTAFIIVLVVAVGLFAVNQFLDYQKKIELLQTPCQLCVSLNPDLISCFEKPVIGPMDLTDYNITIP